MFDNETGKSKGFGFINFEKHEDAQRAIDEMHEKEVDGQRIYCARAQQKAERERHLRQQLEERRRQRIKEMEGRNLFVKNLADSVTDDRLRCEAGPAGSYGAGAGWAGRHGPGAASQPVEAAESPGRARVAWHGPAFAPSPARRELAPPSLSRREMFSEFGTITSAKVMREGLALTFCGGQDGSGHGAV